VTLKVKYADFRQITRRRTGQALLSTRAEIEQPSYALLEPLFPVTKGIRLLGMTLSTPWGAVRQADTRRQRESLARTITSVKDCGLPPKTRAMLPHLEPTI
jgi:hypothetical protein